MNEDYLWNKTGTDVEIEKLENTLKVFRKMESEAPKLPTAYEVVEAAPDRDDRSARWFSFGMVSFACLALLVFGIGMYGLIGLESDGIVVSKPGNKTEPIVSEPVQGELAKVSVVNTPRLENEEPNPLVSAKATKANFRKFKKPRRIVKRFKNARPVEPKVQKLVLTAEEKHAYNQLMLALNITSSNLKLVKDKVQGDE